MVAREYEGAGGMRLHLTEPLDPMMAAQVDRGDLRLVGDGEPLFDVDRGIEPQVVQNGADAPAATRVGLNVPGAPECPDVDAHAGAWATYAVRLGLLATKASTMGKVQLIEWVQAVEAVDGTSQVGDAGEGAFGPEHASVNGRPNDASGEEAPLEVPEEQTVEPPVAPTPDGQRGSDGDGADVKRPNANSKVDDWRAYAVSLGMDEGDAQESTKKELQDWVAVAEGDDPAGSGE
ncbi:hypothetical protein ACN2WE_05085 [Streptomyces sp. cg28]|uniref:hypothetical protein n=1 Tax=Streptomyces sp. cg28 TaxID=3403457 RepID=UPI003B22037B